MWFQIAQLESALSAAHTSVAEREAALSSARSQLTLLTSSLAHERQALEKAKEAHRVQCDQLRAQYEALVAESAAAKEREAHERRQLRDELDENIARRAELSAELERSIACTSQLYGGVKLFDCLSLDGESMREQQVESIRTQLGLRVTQLEVRSF